ncbi:MAG: hypothetical protein KJ971_04100 [Firmicutes bacterium]|nr:hypothetical protein [Bacillota bacterium]
MFKKILAALIVVVALGGSILAFSYWDNLEQTQAETISIGSGVTLTVTAVAEVPVGKVLVPAGVVLKANDVESVVLTYNVKLDLEAADALDLAVVASNIEIGGDDTYASLVTVNVSLAAATVNNTDVLVTVTVTISQPATVVIYDLIKTQPITFDLTFTATQA